MYFIMIDEPKIYAGMQKCTIIEHAILMDVQNFQKKLQELSEPYLHSLANTCLKDHKL